VHWKRWGDGRGWGEKEGEGGAAGEGEGRGHAAKERKRDSEEGTKSPLGESRTPAGLTCLQSAFQSQMTMNGPVANATACGWRGCINGARDAPYTSCTVT